MLFSAFLFKNFLIPHCLQANHNFHFFKRQKGSFKSHFFFFHVPTNSILALGSDSNRRNQPSVQLFCWNMKYKLSEINTPWSFSLLSPLPLWFLFFSFAIRNSFAFVLWRIYDETFLIALQHPFAGVLIKKYFRQFKVFHFRFLW